MISRFPFNRKQRREYFFAINYEWFWKNDAEGEAVLTPDQRINCRSLLEAKALNRFLDDFVVDAELGEALYPSSFHFVDLTDDVLLEFFLIEKQLPQRFGFRNVFLWIE